MAKATLYRRIREFFVRIEPARIQVLEAAMLLVILFVVGTFGYRVLEGWSFMDSLYMTFITLTTIGFSEVAELTDTGRIFTIVIATFGILSIGVIVTRATQLLVSRTELKVKQMERVIRNISDHYIICGFGRIGSRIAANLADAGKQFVIIEYDPEVIKHNTDRDYLWVEGDAELESTLIEAGIERASGLITTLKEDADNVFVTLTAREINPDLFILSRAFSGDSVTKLQRAGANRAVSPYELGADRMASFVLRPKVNRFLELALQSKNLDLSIEEVIVPSDSPIAGKTLRGSRLREDYDAIVVATIGPGDQIQVNPGPNSVMTPGQTLIVLGQADRLKELHERDVVS